MSLGSTTRTVFSSRSQGGSLLVNDMNQIPAAVWYLCSAASGAVDDTSHGYTPDTPFATLSYALSKMGEYDTLLVLPYHAEILLGGDVSTGTGRGRRIVGIGGRDKRPLFQAGDASSALLFNGAGTTIQNCAF